MMNDCGISKLDLKRRNRMQILRAVREYGPISRVDISGILQITRAAVTIITNEMIDQHILEEIGEEPLEPGMEVKKGRRKILLDINETFKFALGIYLDEKELSIGLTTLNSAVLDKKIISHDGSLSIDDVLHMVIETAEIMLKNSCLTTQNLVGVGVGIAPVMWDAMQAETAPDGVMTFPKLAQPLGERFSIPIYAGSAISQFAMAGIHYQESHAKSVNQVFLHWDEEHYYAIPMHGTIELYGTGHHSSHFVERLSVAINGKELEGYPRGSVRAELSKKAMTDAVQPLFSETQTPALFAALEGDLSGLNMAALLTAYAQDEVLRPVVDDLMQKFCVLLNNLHCLYAAEYTCLHGFGFTEENLEQLVAYMQAFDQKVSPDSLVLSPIQERHHFLCGCTYAIQLGFFQRGGLS